MATFEKLFENDDGNGDDRIQVNKTYAKKYQKFKECQELDKLKQKYGNVALNETESSSEEEDDEAEALTPQLEEDFLKTLSMIKSKDPKIYDKKSEFYTDKDDPGNENTNKNKNSKQKEKPLYLKDYERQRLLEKGSKAYLSDSDSDNDESYFKHTKNSSELTYNEEQEQIKNSFKMAGNDSDEDDEDEDRLLQLRDKSSKQKAEEEAEYTTWLKKEGKSVDKLSHHWKGDDNLDDNEKFLRDYILKRQFVADETEGIPSYNEVVGDFDTDEDEREEAELEREEEFERKFNFRYEEPDQEFIKKYPRTIAESVRRVDDSRKLKRAERDERKSKEKEKKKEELKRLKNLKRKEIMEKIEKLKAITGNDKVRFLEEDMDGDFDASKYDQLMESVFDEDYYDVDEEDEEKPEFSDDEDVLLQQENWDEWTGGEGDGNYEEEEGYEPHCEDEDFNMDADFIDTRKPKSSLNDDVNKGKRSSKFAEALHRKKPVFDPNDKTFEEYFDEYYKLDFEDIIGDMPVRFKYRNVLPNNYGLSTEEILEAEDKELNEWCSLKRTIRYNTDAEEKIERQKYKRKGRNKKKKEQVFASMKNEQQQDLEEDDNEENTAGGDDIQPTAGPSHNATKKNETSLRKFDSKSQRGFKKKTILHSKFNVSQKTQPRLRNSLMSKRTATTSTMSNTKQRKLVRRFKGADSKTMEKISTNRLAAYGLDKRKKKETAA